MRMLQLLKHGADVNYLSAQQGTLLVAALKAECCYSLVGILLERGEHVFVLSARDENVATIASRCQPVFEERKRNQCLGICPCKFSQPWAFEGVRKTWIGEWDAPFPSAFMRIFDEVCRDVFAGTMFEKGFQRKCLCILCMAKNVGRGSSRDFCGQGRSFCEALVVRF